jgi:hypothetical protein
MTRLERMAEPMPSTIGFNIKDRLMRMVWLRWVMLISGLSLAVLTTSYAGIPLWTLTPLTATTITITPNDTAIIHYQLTNQSRRPHRLVTMPIPGINQVTTSGNCPNPVSLAYQQSCQLTLAVSPQRLTDSIVGGPVVCQEGNVLQCYQPGERARLAITLVSNTSLPLILSPALLPPVTDNVPYRQTLVASGGVTPYSYALTAGSLPPNFVLDPTTGVISGVLATTATTEVTYSFTVTVTDAEGQMVSLTYSLQANPNLLSFTLPGQYFFTVPNGATRLHVIATGGGGGAGGNTSGASGRGGAGCMVTSTFQVAANQVFTLIVGGGGGSGVNDDGTSGGGGGGGSTNLFPINSSTPILIAGGGGGGSFINNEGGNGCITSTGAGGAGGGSLGGAGGSDGNGGGTGGRSGDGGSGGAGAAGGSIGGVGGSSSGSGSGGNGAVGSGSGGGGGGYGGGDGGGLSGFENGGGAGGSGVLDLASTSMNTIYTMATNGGINSNNGGDGSLIINFE